MKAKFRHQLPQSSGRLFLTDGGLETTLIFDQGLDLPSFASFPLLESETGREALKNYYRPFLRLAAELGAGFILDTPTWRANPDWAAKLGFSTARTQNINREAIALLEELRAEFNPNVIVLCGCIGPRGDGYLPGSQMRAEEAQRYHSFQISTFAETSADMIGAFTLNYAEEAIGIAKAACASQMPVTISFTVETDGTLPSGQSLRGAIEQVEQETRQAPAYYLVNCAHPTHFLRALQDQGDWTSRLRGVRANSSRKSHVELEQCTVLDRGDPEELAEEYLELRSRLPAMNVAGGCCGTGVAHVRAIAERWK